MGFVAYEVEKKEMGMCSKAEFTAAHVAIRRYCESVWWIFP